ncbi:MAG: hypothetical protein JJE19_02710 [Methanosarcinales archaeon]|nr:hypothetical protein [Methanosarcinales archaeon]
MERKADRRKRTPRKSGEKKKQNNNSKKADFYLNVKVYQRDARGGFYEFKGKPLEKGMRELKQFIEDKFDVQEVQKQSERDVYKPDSFDPEKLTKDLNRRFGGGW